MEYGACQERLPEEGTGIPAAAAEDDLPFGGGTTSGTCVSHWCCGQVLAPLPPPPEPPGEPPAPRGPEEVTLLGVDSPPPPPLPPSPQQQDSSSRRSSAIVPAAAGGGAAAAAVVLLGGAALLMRQRRRQQRRQAAVAWLTMADPWASMGGAGSTGAGATSGAAAEPYAAVTTFEMRTLPATLAGPTALSTLLAQPAGTGSVLHPTASPAAAPTGAAEGCATAAAPAGCQVTIAPSVPAAAGGAGCGGQLCVAAAPPGEAASLAEEVVLQEQLGAGAFGTVYKGLWGGRPVAVKVLQTPCNASSRELESFRVEARLLSNLQHPHIVCLLAACMGAPGWDGRCEPRPCACSTAGRWPSHRARRRWLRHLLMTVITLHPPTTCRSAAQHLHH